MSAIEQAGSRAATAALGGSTPSTIASEIDRHRSSRSENLTLPTRWYRDPDVLAFEFGEVFSRSWQLAGPVAQVSQPGAQLVTTVGQIPIVVTRARDGVLRALVNVCQHRAYPVAAENRIAPLLQCQYHGWTYNLDGSLRSAPLCGREEFADREIRLRPASVDVWNGLVFVNPNPKAGTLADSFPELVELGREWELDFENRDYEYQGVTTLEIEGNWKAWCENSNECYHCPTIHRESFDAEFKSLKDREVRLTANLVAAINGYRDTGVVLERHGMSPTFGERYVYLYPGTFFSKDDYHVFAGYTVPVAVDRTQFVSHSWARTGLDPAFSAEWDDMWERTLREDAEAVRLQNAGLRSGMLRNGQLSGEADQMILKFHELVVRSYAAVHDRA
jgi:choline monooxygenase